MFFGLPNGEMPPELQAQLEAQQAHEQMHRQDEVHRRNAFLDKLNEDDIDLLDTIVFLCRENKQFSAYMRGQIAMFRMHKFGTCTCGVNHAEEAKEMLNNPPSEDRDSLTKEVIEKDDPDDDPEGIYEPEIVEDGNAALRAASSEFDQAAERADNMKKYGLEEWDGKYRCTNCHLSYESVEDRMLRSPGIDGCHGCQHKAATGQSFS